MTNLNGNIGVNIVKESDKKVKVTRTKLPGRDVYEVSFESILEIVDTWSGNIIDHLAVSPMPSIKTFGVDARASVRTIAEFLASHMRKSDEDGLFGTGIILGSTNAYINYIQMCRDNDPDRLGRVIVKFVSDRYEMVDGELKRKKII